MTAMNPQGTTVTGFKQPTEEELAHDFLWRVHPHAPGRGQVAVFNRSHYEDVLVVRVHNLVPKAVWSKRYEQINALREAAGRQRHHHPQVLPATSRPRSSSSASSSASTIPTRQWKISDTDYKERGFWDDYVKAYEAMLEQCSTDARALVRDPVEPQVVPQPRGLADPRRHARRTSG